ncbi:MULTISPECIES: helix-turn-helix domain-containing protein [unclassified Nocardiopsis]|uniref:helix-turn-helix domain-containing protein n=1 Tax=unclassified Nocardiopsis TaxID=2649073 RepID=UPI00135AC188|nr:MULTISPECIES: helix-turn-helix domain-containing protein [unclassified Nocardiopsis]
MRSSVLAGAPRIEPGAGARSVARKVVREAADRGSRLVLKLADGDELTLPESLVKILLASASELSEGRAARVLASETSLTPAEAAELLGLSRPFVVRLLDAGEIPSERLPDSRHRVVRLDDVLEFQARRERRREGRRRINEAVESAELPY